MPLKLPKKRCFFGFETKTGWWFQPLWKTWVKMGIFPRVRGENKTYLKPPPSFVLRPKKNNPKFLKCFPLKWKNVMFFLVSEAVFFSKSDGLFLALLSWVFEGWVWHVLPKLETHHGSFCSSKNHFFDDISCPKKNWFLRGKKLLLCMNAPLPSSKAKPCQAKNNEKQMIHTHTQKLSKTPLQYRHPHID